MTASPLTRDELDRLAQVGTAQVCDILGDVAFDTAIHATWPAPPFAGPAATGAGVTGHNHALRAAVDAASPGDVVVVDARGSTARAVLGDLVARRALRCGVAGFVIDGAIRDLAAIEELGLAVHARGTSPVKPLQDPLGEHGVPVSVGGRVVNPGDIVVADRDGAVVIPRADARRVFALADANERAERAAIAQGRDPLDS